jgi:predicted peptidase
MRRIMGCGLQVAGCGLSRSPHSATRNLIQAVALIALSLCSCRTMAPRETGFLNRDGFMVYVPRGFDPARPWPVILFLHGAGERGVDGLRPTQIGMGPAIRSHPELVQAIVVFPQVPPDQRWIGAPAENAMHALDAAIREFHGDPHRVYLTGLSMGGYGVWHLALAHPDRFAALLVVCGGLLPHPTATSVARSPLVPADADPYPYVAHALRRIPIRIFHGTIDPVIPVEESRQMFAALRAEGADVDYTEYPEMGHNAWDRAYSPDLLRWLFAQKR